MLTARIVDDWLDQVRMCLSDYDNDDGTQTFWSYWTAAEMTELLREAVPVMQEKYTQLFFKEYTACPVTTSKA